MTEQDAILETLQLYLDGGRVGSSDVMKPAFHQNATMFSSLDGVLDGGDIQTLFERVDARGPSPDLISEIGPIDVSHTTATVRVELHNWGGIRFSDQFTLIKTAEGWRIMNKVFHRH